MKWIIKYCLICIFLCGTFLIKGFSQDGIFARADSLLAAGLNHDARIELEKLAFFSKNRQTKTDALIRKANCYKQEQNFQKEAETLNRIFLVNLPDSLGFEIKYEKALAYYLNNEPGRAIFELQALQRFKDPEKASRTAFLSALTYSDMKNWEASKNAAVDFIELTVESKEFQYLKKTRIDSLFSEKNLPKTLSPKKAKHLSTFIPGGGQFYSGKIGEGLFSLGLHVGLAYFGISQFLDKFYLTGYTAGFGLLQRLYTGNLQRVQNLVKEVNQKRYDEFYKAYFNILTSTNKP